MGLVDDGVGFVVVADDCDSFFRASEDVRAGEQCFDVSVASPMHGKPQAVKLLVLSVSEGLTSGT